MLDQIFAYAHAHKSALMWVSIASARACVGSLRAVPKLVARAPADFFTRESVPQQGFGRLCLRVLRNLIGWVLLLAGIAMLVLPGQGPLMVLLALSLVALPKKRALVRKIVKRPPVWRALCYFRERA